MMERLIISLIMENTDGKLILNLSNLSNDNDYLILINNKPIDTDSSKKYVLPLSQLSPHNITIIKKPLKTKTKMIIETLAVLLNSDIAEFNKIMEISVIYRLDFQVICNNMSEIIFKDFESKIEIVSSSATIVPTGEHIEYDIKNIKIMYSIYLAIFYVPLILFSLFLIAISFSMLIHHTVLEGIGLLFISCIILLLLNYLERKTGVLKKCVNILKNNKM